MNNNTYGFFRSKFCQANISIFSDRAAGLANKGETIDVLYLDIRYDFDYLIEYFPNQTRKVYLKSYILTVLPCTEDKKIQSASFHL